MQRSIDVEQSPTYIGVIRKWEGKIIADLYYYLSEKHPDVFIKELVGEAEARYCKEYTFRRPEGTTTADQRSAFTSWTTPAYVLSWNKRHEDIVSRMYRLETYIVYKRNPSHEHRVDVYVITDAKVLNSQGE